MISTINIKLFGQFRIETNFFTFIKKIFKLSKILNCSFVTIIEKRSLKNGSNTYLYSMLLRNLLAVLLRNLGTLLVRNLDRNWRKNRNYFNYSIIIIKKNFIFNWYDNSQSQNFDFTWFARLPGDFFTLLNRFLHRDILAVLLGNLVKHSCH